MDRTAEFKAAVNSLQTRAGGGHFHSHPRDNTRGTQARRGKEALAYAEFSQLAKTIANDIGDTQSKLDKLTKLVKKKGLFDDRPVEISELTHHIKQDLSRLNAQTGALQKHVRATAARATKATRQMDEHSSNLVIILQSKLANTSMGFKEALELRSESMQASKKRQEQLLQSGAGNQPQQLQLQQQQQQQQLQQPSPLLTPTSILSPLRNNSKSPMGLVATARTPTPTSQYLQQQNIPYGRGGSPFGQNDTSTSPNHYPLNVVEATNSSIDDPYQTSSMHRRKGGRSDGAYEDDSEAAGPASMLYQQQQQQQYAPLSEQSIQNRSTAIEAVESTLQELGGIFQQLAQMVAEQRDTVQRIEANAEDIELNINEAQNQLLRYYRNISSDRQMMIKIFLTIIFVFLVMSLMS
ncbi:cis-Golgi t-SNARE syntaxin [Podila humilis]|nr:cis-Golgi t-SNARE syntaxin [Podila humilis]